MLSECCSKRRWRAGCAARQVNFRRLGSGIQFGVLLIEKQHFVRVREVNLDDRHGTVRSGVIDNRHGVIVVVTLAVPAFTGECHTTVVAFAPFDFAFCGEDHLVMLQECHRRLRTVSFPLDSVFTCRQDFPIHYHIARKSHTL